MTIRTAPLALLAVLPLLALAGGCDCADPAPGPSTTAAPLHEPTDARAMQRAAERWDLIQKGDVYAAFPYGAPEFRTQHPLVAMIERAKNHRYESMRPVEVVARQGDDIFLRVKGLWTPLHPMTKQVELEPGQSLTQPMEVIETWRWVEGDWHYLMPQRPEEFAKSHAELLRTPSGG